MRFTTEHINYRHFNDRDVEMPALLLAVEESLPQVERFLDVGADYSHATYARPLRQLLEHRTYHACDVINDKNTAALVDQFLVGNIKDLSLEPYDFVSCISALEHAGFTSYQVTDWQLERTVVFLSLCHLARHRLFLTFPFGAPGVFPGQYANVTDDNLNHFTEYAKAWHLEQVETRFFYTEFAQGQKPWREIDRTDAKTIPLDKAKGTQCLCIFDARSNQRESVAA